MSNYKNYLLRQMGIKESQVPPSTIDRNAFEGIDPDELEMGKEDEAGEHNMSPDEAELTARQHLGAPKQGHYYSGMENAKNQGMLKDALMGGAISPTAIPTPVIAIGVRGSTTGGFPSGIDQSGIPSNTPTGRLGGYEPIPTAKDNNVSFNKTPVNPSMMSPNTKTENPSTTIDPHPHQTQRSQGEPPQAVTGASTDGGDSPLTLKSAAPKGGIDIDVSEEGKEKEEGESNDMDGEESMEDEDRSKQDLNEGKCNGKADCSCSNCSDEKHDVKHDKDVKKGKGGSISQSELNPDDKIKFTLKEGKHKAGCQCGFCTNKKRFGKKDEDDGDDQTEKDEKGGDKKEKFGGLDETFAKHKSYAFESMKTLGSFIKEESQPEPYDAKTDQFAPGPRDRTNEPTANRGLPSFKITYDDGESYVTSMAKNVTLQMAQEYFLGKTFTMPDEVTKKRVVKVEPFTGGNLGGNPMKENVGAKEPFTTKWKMDKEKAGMVKLTESNGVVGSNCQQCKGTGRIDVKGQIASCPNPTCRDGKVDQERYDAYNKSWSKWGKPQPTEGLVKLSEAFEKMRGLANLGERRVLSNGLWGNITEEKKKQVCFHCKKTRPCSCDKYDDENQEASDPESPKFDWKRFGTDKPRPADYKEGIDRTRLNEIKNTLNAKAQAGTMTAKETKLYGLVKEALSKQK